jgi:RNA polymerase sigma-70 factor (ECF subfamily)
MGVTGDRLATTDEFGVLFRELAPRMWRALLAFSGSPEIAQDAVSEAFAQAIRRADGIRSPERWVWKAAYRIAAGALQQRGRDTELREDLSSSPAVEPAWELRAALLRLSRSQRASLVLYYYFGYPTAEIAKIIGSTPAAVRVHLMRGRRRLRVLLEEDPHD